MIKTKSQKSFLKDGITTVNNKVSKVNKHILLALKTIGFLLPVMAIVFYFIYRNKSRKEADLIMWLGFAGVSTYYVLDVFFQEIVYSAYFFIMFAPFLYQKIFSTKGTLYIEESNLQKAKKVAGKTVMVLGAVTYFANLNILIEIQSVSNFIVYNLPFLFVILMGWAVLENGKLNPANQFNTSKRELYKSPNLVETTPEEYLKARGEVSNSMTISMFPGKSPGKPSNALTKNE